MHTSFLLNNFRFSSLLVFILLLITLLSCSKSESPTTPPIAQFSTEKSSDKTVQFFDKSLNDPVSWEWKFEGGNPVTSIEKNPVVEFLTYGTHEVELTVTNAAGDETISKAILITEPGLYLSKINYTDSKSIILFLSEEKQLNGYYYHDIDKQSSSNTTGLEYNFDYFYSDEGLLEEVRHHNLANPFRLKHNFVSFDEKGFLVEEDRSVGAYPAGSGDYTAAGRSLYINDGSNITRRENYDAEGKLVSYQSFEYDVLNRLRFESSFLIEDDQETIDYTLEMTYDDKKNPFIRIASLGFFDDRFDPVYLSENNLLSLIKTNSYGTVVNSESYNFAYTYNEEGFPESLLKTSLDGDIQEHTYEYDLVN